jgi:hypothetical protein
VVGANCRRSDNERNDHRRGVGDDSGFEITAAEKRASDDHGRRLIGAVHVWYLITFVIDNERKESRLYLDADRKKSIPLQGVQ